MVRRAAQVSDLAARVGGGGGYSAPPSSLLTTATEARSQAPKEDLPENLTLLAEQWILFTDPAWGAVALRVLIYRDKRNDLPEYHVVVE